VDAQNWQSNFKRIITFATVEEFWCLFNNLVAPEALPPRSNYYLFKEGIIPEWEDPMNSLGGKWTVPLGKDSDINTMWLFLLLAVIGGTLPFAEEICGVVISLRSGKNRMALWTKNADEKEKCLEIGRSLKSVLEITRKISYQVHKDALERSVHGGYSDRYNI